MEWISVNDKFPEDYHYVLVYAYMNGTGEPCGISIARRYGREWEILNDQGIGFFLDSSLYISSKEITHWMPLPKRPNELD
jgi:hypothetical protein